LSNRPWDNGWAAPQSQEDCVETHPYFLSKLWKNYWADDKKFALSDMANISGRPSVRKEQQKDRLPIIINEYGWLWLNRDGTTTCLTGSVYEKLLGPDSTVAARRLLYARYLAALTEFWRTHRECAGVLHFCGLGYSRAGDKPRPEGGATSDHFIDLEKLTFEPNFEKYVRDAFSPVGLMIDFWAEQLDAGSQQKFEVVLINDLHTLYKGTIRIAIERGGETVAEKMTNCQINGLDRSVLTFDMKIPKEEGQYQLIAELTGSDGTQVRSLRDFKVQAHQE
jgi:hypothetical protein